MSSKGGPATAETRQRHTPNVGHPAYRRAADGRPDARRGGAEMSVIDETARRWAGGPESFLDFRLKER